MMTPPGRGGGGAIILVLLLLATRRCRLGVAVPVGRVIAAVVAPSASTAIIAMIATATALIVPLPAGGGVGLRPPSALVVSRSAAEVSVCCFAGSIGTIAHGSSGEGARRAAQPGAVGQVAELILQPLLRLLLRLEAFKGATRDPADEVVALPPIVEDADLTTDGHRIVLRLLLLLLLGILMSHIGSEARWRAEAAPK
jgi:hypothetical protein